MRTKYSKIKQFHQCLKRLNFITELCSLNYKIDSMSMLIFSLNGTNLDSINCVANIERIIHTL